MPCEAEAEASVRDRIARVLREALGAVGTARGLTGVAIACGILFRVADYLNDRGMWDDETYLGGNVVGVPAFAFGRPLTNDQIAAPGFLVVARLASRVLGGSTLGLRLIPLLCGISALFALAEVARRAISPRAVPVALALAAVSDDLIYYATEFKQYSSDLLIACGCLLLAIDLDRRPLTPLRLVVASLLGSLALWCSHPSSFVLAGAGLWLAIGAAFSRRWRRLGSLAILGAAWGVNFAGCYRLSRRMLGASPLMWDWWDFAFLRIPPRSLAEARQLFWQIANVFTNPLGIVTPLSPVVGGLAGLSLFLIGLISLAQARRWSVLAFLTAPILLALFASSLHRYPFHGRVILFLIPCLLLPLAEGLDLIRRRLGRAAFAVLVAFLLYQPSLDAVDNIDRRRGHMYDSHGDQRNDLLDYLDPHGR